MTILSRLDLTSTALLLDVDGTLVDIGPDPRGTHVSDDLRASLSRLAELTGGAVALVSGRPIADLDRMFAPLRLSLIGGHGAEMRVNGHDTTLQVKPLPRELREWLSRLAAPGILIEDKAYSVAVHYRGAPHEAYRVRAYMKEGCARYPEEGLDLLVGKAVLELKRRDVSKGAAVRSLMDKPPFRARTPVFIGDDVTDESVFRILPALQGKGFSVGRHFAGLTGRFETPEDVRGALQHLANNGAGA
jgi:trehalose 6-phosphate phosphatase